MRRCSTVLAIREMQIKAIVICDYTPIRISKIKKIGCREIELLIYCWWEWQMAQPLGKLVCQFLIKTNMHLPYSWTFIPRKWKFMVTQKPVHRSFIIISLQLKTAQVPFTGWMVKPTGSSISCNAAWQWTIDTCNHMAATTWLNLQRFKLRGKKPIPKDYILCDSIYITLLKWQNHISGDGVGRR